MSIVSSRIVSAITSAVTGRTKAEIAFRDSGGEEHIIVYSVAPGVDVDTFRTSMHSQIAKYLDTSERNEVIRRIEDGEDSEVLARNPVHSTQKALAKTLVRHLMQNSSVSLVLKMKSFLQYLNNNFTDAQLRTLLDLNASELTRFKNRIAPILGSQVEGAIQDYQDAKEDWR